MSRFTGEQIPCMQLSAKGFPHYRKTRLNHSIKVPRPRNLEATIFPMPKLQTQQLSVPCGITVIYTRIVNPLQLAQLVTSTANLVKAYYS